MGDTRGCLRGDECNYMHISSKKGIHVKRNPNNHDTTRETQNKTDNKEKLIENRNDEMVHELTEARDAKDEEIKQMNENVSKLIAENKGLIEENTKVKIILKKMDQEIKLLRSRTK